MNAGSERGTEASEADEAADSEDCVAAVSADPGEREAAHVVARVAGYDIFNRSYWAIVKERLENYAREREDK